MSIFTEIWVIIAYLVTFALFLEVKTTISNKEYYRR